MKIRCADETVIKIMFSTNFFALIDREHFSKIQVLYKDNALNSNTLLKSQNLCFQRILMTMHSDIQVGQGERK